MLQNAGSSYSGQKEWKMPTGFSKRGQKDSGPDGVQEETTSG